MNTFLFKETNYTKRGKTVKGKIWNRYPQMLKSIKHSLRLQNDKNIHIIKSRTKDNVIISNTDTTILFEYIKNKISSNIKDFENITTSEAERKKIFKDFSNVKSAISKKIPLEILDKELKTYKHKIKNLKAKDKRTLKTLKRYIELKRKYEDEKTHKKYNNQVLLKEILFKIPENQNLELNNEQWKMIIDKFKQKYFDEYEMFFGAIHNDEGREYEVKGHVHMFISGFNDKTKEFDIKRNIFSKISRKYNLKLDYNNKDNHKKIMNLFQKDFYDFFNNELSQMGIPEKIEFNNYQDIDKLNQRLKIQKEDYLTIDEKHEKFANKMIESECKRFELDNKYKKIDFKISENILGNSLTIKTNIPNNGNNNRVKLFTKMLKISQFFSNYISRLTEKIKELRAKLHRQESEIKYLKNEISEIEHQQDKKLKQLEKTLKEDFKKDKELAIKESITKKDEIIKDIKNKLWLQERKNETLLSYKIKYRKFEKTFGIDISKKLKSLKDKKAHHLGDKEVKYGFDISL